MPSTIPFSHFEALSINVGRIVSMEAFPEGKYSSHILQIDFGGEIGVKKSLARLTPRYDDHNLVGRQVLAVTNFEPRQIGTHLSEVLTLGVSDEEGNVVLVHPAEDVPLGSRLH